MCTCDNSWISDRVPIKLDTGKTLLNFVKNIKYCLKSEGRKKRVNAFLGATHGIFTRPKRLSNKNEEVYQCVVHSLYRSSTRGPEGDSVESKHVAQISHYMFNITTVVFDGSSPPFILQTLRDGTPQVQIPRHSHCALVSMSFSLSQEY